MTLHPEEAIILMAPYESERLQSSITRADHHTEYKILPSRRMLSDCRYKVKPKIHYR